MNWPPFTYEKNEYIRLEFDWGDLMDLNSLAQNGWKVISTEKNVDTSHSYWALLERPCPR